MDDKAYDKVSLLPQTEVSSASVQRTTPAMARKRRSQFQLAAFLFLGTIFWMAMRWSCGHHHEDEVMGGKKVPLEIHIMSKCPDTRMCLEKLIVPTMANASSHVSFHMSYIGRTSPNSDDVNCPHGQTECLGNILELCAAAEYPDPKIYLGYTMCLSRRYPEIPKKELAEDCALEHGIDFSVLNDCMSRDDGAYGMGLLRDSVKRSEEAGVKTSCTVRLDGKERCVVDGQEFRDCEGGSTPEDLVRDIEKLYNRGSGGVFGMHS